MKNFKWWITIALTFLIVIPSLATAAKGVIVYYKSGCDYYIVETNRGYALLEWYGGNDPNEGDAIVGDYESYGMKNIFNISADSETRVWVEDYGLSKDRIIEKYYEKCR